MQHSPDLNFSPKNNFFLIKNPRGALRVSWTALPSLKGEQDGRIDLRRRTTTWHWTSSNRRRGGAQDGPAQGSAPQSLLLFSHSDSCAEFLSHRLFWSDVGLTRSSETFSCQRPTNRLALTCSKRLFPIKKERTETQTVLLELYILK